MPQNGLLTSLLAISESNETEADTTNIELEDDWFPIFSLQQAADGAGGQHEAPVCEDNVADDTLEDAQIGVLAVCSDDDDGSESLPSSRLSPNGGRQEPSVEHGGSIDNLYLAEATAAWPHPLRRVPGLQSAGALSRVRYHGQRYSHFVQSYCHLSDDEAASACRRNRSICVIGVSKASKVSKGVVRAQRAFLRHAVLSVEGDAVFAELMDQAEALYAKELQAVKQNLPLQMQDLLSPRGKRSVLGDFEADVCCGYMAGNRKRAFLPNPRRLSTRCDVPQSPNARCIALHYGLPADRSAQECSGEAKGDATYPRATLIAVVASTRLQEHEPIYVSLESYYRCLDEPVWYARCFGGRVTQQTGYSSHPGCASVGDICTGVKRFRLWPAGLPYYHGVGERHASDTAEAGFPFTLVDLCPVPELGSEELGITAESFIPYATCFLYTGPAVATKKVEERLEQARGGGTGSRTAFPRDEPPACNSTRNTDLSSSMHTATGEKDLSFVLDDTYALSLGKHCVCFGQGATRYINHRYNLSRFGNVELSSVMLSVRSEFSAIHSTVGGGCATATRKRARRGHGRRHNAKKVALGKRTTASCGFTSAGARQAGSSESLNGIPSVSMPASPSTTRKSIKRYRSRRSRCIFFEDQSHFVTIPFFMATTDIEPCTPLVAWTYGEAYDARLERDVVAGGLLVPHTDAALLNARCGQPLSLPSPMPDAGRCWQRYSGDYRFAISAGDIVWRRRPIGTNGCVVRASPSLPSALALPESLDGDRGPEDELFVVVQTMRSSTEWLLLRLLCREKVPEEQLHAMLEEEGVRWGRPSPHSNGGAELPDPDKNPASHRSRSGSLRDTLAVYQVNVDKELKHCVVASACSVALLHADIDYILLGRSGKGPTGKSEARIAVNIRDLRCATDLVLSSSRSRHVAPLCNGMLWPIFRTQSKHVGYEALNDNKRRGKK